MSDHRHRAVCRFPDLDGIKHTRKVKEDACEQLQQMDLHKVAAHVANSFFPSQQTQSMRTGPGPLLSYFLRSILLLS